MLVKVCGSQSGLNVFIAVPRFQVNFDIAQENKKPEILNVKFGLNPVRQYNYGSPSVLVDVIRRLIPICVII